MLESSMIISFVAAALIYLVGIPFARRIIAPEYHNEWSEVYLWPFALCGWIAGACLWILCTACKWWANLLVSPGGEEPRS